MDDEGWPRYVPVAERRRRALKTVAKMKAAGREALPVEISGRTITTTFWGGAWCKNLESYSDFANRLPRGRTYVRNGSVIDLQAAGTAIRALVSGSALYSVDIAIKPLPKKRWKEIKGKCAGQIGSLVELLRGSLSAGVMKVVTCKPGGMFPSPSEISLGCSCPDSATMCKHVAAVLYGVGARLDQEPELLFTLRGVDPGELVEAAITQPAAAGKAGRRRVLDPAALSSVFGIEIDAEASASAPRASKRRPSRKKVAKKKVAKKKVAKKKVAKKPKKKE
ncbi:MAG: SWIM zinc finger family protein [Nannocystaceae bacterium]|nr:SWIM zinc finger family protein [Nannocystaceae bacterium]